MSLRRRRVHVRATRSRCLEDRDVGDDAPRIPRLYHSPRRTLRLVSVFVVTIGLLVKADTPLNLQGLDLQAVDRSCRPCDDFYQLAIGKRNAAHPIPANQRRWGK